MDFYKETWLNPWGIPDSKVGERDDTGKCTGLGVVKRELRPRVIRKTNKKNPFLRKGGENQRYSLSKKESCDDQRTQCEEVETLLPH